MNLYIVRHADAGDRQAWTGDDADRPLTDLGRRQARALAEALKRRGLALDAIVSSPLVRTRQTAEELIPAASDGTGLRFSDLLAPDALKPRRLSKYLAGLGAASAAVVGHDPDLPAYLGWLLGVDPDNVHLEKGGAALVTFDDGPSKGDGRLAWAVTPEWVMTATPEPTGG